MSKDYFIEVRPGVYRRYDDDGRMLEQHVSPSTIMKARRKELGMSMQELGDRIGVSKATISRYESGQIEKLPVTYLTPIAEALQVDPMYLLGSDDKWIKSGSSVEYRVVPVPTVEESAFNAKKSETELLIEKYNDAPDHVKQAIRSLLQMD